MFRWKKAWLATQEEAGHGKAVVPLYGLNLLNGGPAERISSAIALSILRKKEGQIVPPIVQSSLSHEFLWVLVGKLEENLSELLSVQLLQNTQLVAIVLNAKPLTARIHH